MCGCISVSLFGRQTKSLLLKGSLHCLCSLSSFSLPGARCGPGRLAAGAAREGSKKFVMALHMDHIYVFLFRRVARSIALFLEPQSDVDAHLRALPDAVVVSTWSGPVQTRPKGPKNTESRGVQDFRPVR